MKPKILITNDDGVDAKGIQALFNALQKTNRYDLLVVAPETERSGTGCAITWDRPIQLRELDWGHKAWSCSANPADCVKLALSVICKRAPVLIVSGINQGSNAGRNILHSGTCGAAIEAVLRNIPAIAFSVCDDRNPNFDQFQNQVVSFVEYTLTNPFRQGSFLNVNFPKNPVRPHKIQLTRQGMGRWIENPKLHIDSLQGPSYWLGGKETEFVEIEDCDVSLVKKGITTAVCVHVHELTDQIELASRKEDFQKKIDDSMKNCLL